MTKDVKAIFFDLDGTIYDRKGLKYYFIWSFFWQLKYLTSFLKARKNIQALTFENKDQFNQHLLSLMVQLSGRSLEQCNAFVINFMNSFVRILKRHYKAEEQILKAINYYANSEVKLVCLSDHIFVKERLEALNVDVRKFDLLKSTEDYGALKPSPKSFLAIAEELNLAPSDIVMIGDRDDTDGEGARASNMSFIKYPEDFSIINNIIDHA